jgi:FdhD protein/molybdopterin-guanine dinucleotide biosynthesis protein A
MGRFVRTLFGCWEATLKQLVEHQSVSGIILAGGQSSRLGQNKALVDAGGMLLIERVLSQLLRVVDDVVLVTNSPEQFAFLDVPMAGDLYPGVGTLGGLHAGLSAVYTDYGLVVGCDMPFLNPSLLQYMLSLRSGYDIVIPRLGTYHEPLHAIYSRHCLPCIEQTILAGRRRILSVCDDVRVHYVEDDQIARHDPQHLSFFNVNSPQDLAEMRALLAARNNT